MNQDELNLSDHSIDFTYLETVYPCMTICAESKLSPCPARKSGLFKPLSLNKFFIPRIVFNYLPGNYHNTHKIENHLSTRSIYLALWCMDMVFLLSKSYSEEMNT